MKAYSKPAEKRENNMRRSYSDKIFDSVNFVVMILLIVVFAWPLWFIVIASISDPDVVLSGEVFLLPRDITFDGYKRLFEYKEIWVGYANSIFYTVVGTIFNMVMSICLAYPMSEKSFAPRKILMPFFMFTMYFSGGLIPTYLLYRDIGIVNTRWAILLPGMVSVYNSLIIRSFFMNSIPVELKDSSKIDGANAFQYLCKIVLPLSKPVFAVVGLYYMVANWNNYTKALYYIYDDSIAPLQTIVRRLVMSSKFLADLATDTDPEMLEQLMEQSQLMQYGVIMVAAIPVLCIYPFVQRYFVKGAMVGAVKG